MDSCLEKLISSGIQHGYSFIIIADHGNADVMTNEDGSPNTAHSLNPVPFIVLDNNTEKVKDGILADVAPSILDLMKLNQPKQMTGKSLLN